MSEQPKINLVQKKLINSILYGKFDVMNISYARIFTAEIKSENWLYSGLQGALVYCIKVDSKYNACHFLMLDLKTYETVFDCEIYKKFDKAYKKGTEYFYYYEINNGFIGFKFLDMHEAEILYAQIQNFRDDYIKKKLKEYKPLKGKDLVDKSKKMINKLDKKFQKENISNREPREEIILTNGRIEKEINTVQLDEDSGNLIIKGNGYEGIENDMLKIKELDFVFKNGLKVGNPDVFSRYIS